MRRDVVVTTPARCRVSAAQEAYQCQQAGGGFYFRTFRHRPRDMDVGSRIFYTEAGFVRGFGVVSEIREGTLRCETTGKVWAGFHAVIPAKSWKWIKPLPLRGFLGWRYFEPEYIGTVEIVGGWRDPMPETPVAVRKGAKRGSASR